MPELLEGTTGLVVGVANKRSIAWAIARKLDRQGQRLALTYQGERTEGDVRKLAETLRDCAAVLPLDVQDDAQVAAAVGRRGRGARRRHRHPRPRRGLRAPGGPGRALRGHLPRGLPPGARRLGLLAGRAGARGGAAHARARGGSIMTLSYIAGDRAVPGYNVMGVAKAALESIVRYLAWDLGDGGIRVNAISAGPVRTLAARGIPGFGTMAEKAAERTPLRRDITARTRWPTPPLFLASPLSASVTGETMFVDAGFHAMGF